MANKIVLKKSSVAAKVPVAGDLDFGELAINYTDGKLYFKKADNTIDAFTTAAASAPVTSVGGNIGDITDAQLLASIKNVDGTGSGLDADTLDGNHASAFYLASNPNGYTSNTGTVTSVGATAPLVSSGGTAPSISIPAANSTTNGYMSSAYASKLDGIAAGANNYTLPAATSTALGGIELFSDTVQTVAANAVTATASRTYGVQVNSSGQAVVNVPWTDTNSGGTVTSVSGTGSYGGLTLSGTVTSSGSLTLGGTPTGTWPISVSGSAATATTATNVNGGTATISGINGTDGMIENLRGAYLHIGGWGVGRTDSTAVLVNTAYRSDISDYASSAGSVAWTNVSGRPTAVSSFTNDSGYITSGGRAYPRRSDGTDLNFYWSGQGGQPNWLWGGNDGSNMYVYNPSNFSVNYASSAGNADTVDGYHASAFIRDNGTSLSGSTGYTRLSNGVIIQWGYGGGSYYATNYVSFPLTFPNACRSVVCVAYADGVVFMSGFNTSQFWFHDVAQAANDVYWIAIGH